MDRQCSCSSIAISTTAWSAAVHEEKQQLLGSIYHILTQMTKAAWMTCLLEVIYFPTSDYTGMLGHWLIFRCFWCWHVKQRKQIIPKHPSWVHYKCLFIPYTTASRLPDAPDLWDHGVSGVHSLTHSNWWRARVKPWSQEHGKKVISIWWLRQSTLCWLQITLSRFCWKQTRQLRFSWPGTHTESIRLGKTSENIESKL